MSNQADGNLATSTGPTSSGAAASQLPLSPSAPAPASLSDPAKPDSTPVSNTSPVEILPAAAVGQAAPIASDGNVRPPLLVEAPDHIILEGDPNRFKYAFFAQIPVYLGFNNYVEGSQLSFVFTQDANFCSRIAAPLHVQELLAYQYSYPENQNNPYLGKVFNISTWPDSTAWFGPVLTEDEKSKFDDPNFVWFNCSLTNTARGGRSFSQASWALKTAPGENINDASSITIDFHARNKAQEVSWSLNAHRCNRLNEFFDFDGGHHPRPLTVYCSKSPEMKED